MLAQVMFDFEWWQLAIVMFASWVVGFMCGIGGREDWHHLVIYLKKLWR